MLEAAERAEAANLFAASQEDFRKRFDRKPELIVEAAILRMLPKSKLGRQMISKLNIYRGDKHPHEAQKPEALALEVRA